MLLRFGLLFHFVAFCCGLLQAQDTAVQDSSIYKGLRISIFGIEVLKQKPERISLRLQVANTGRLPVSFGKKKQRAPESLVIEIDTVNLPVILRGREQQLTNAVRTQKIKLAPGDILDELKLDVDLNPDKHAALPEPSEINISEKGCADLVFDTAYIIEYTDNLMRLQYFIRNVGSAPAYLLGTTTELEDNLAVNVYFVSGTKLTRGAILADGIFIREGRETIGGLLQPGQLLQGEMSISLKNRTRFTPNLIFELDPFQQVNDCVRTNNIELIKMEF